MFCKKNSSSEIRSKQLNFLSGANDPNRVFFQGQIPFSGQVLFDAILTFVLSIFKCLFLHFLSFLLRVFKKKIVFVGFSIVDFLCCSSLLVRASLGMTAFSLI